MFFRKLGPSSREESWISARTRIDGDVIFSGAMRLDGSVHGKIRTLPGQNGTLVVGQSGIVDGDVAVQHLLVNGRIDGRIVVPGSLEFRSTARVVGEVCYRTIRVQEGAIIDARLAQEDTRSKGQPEIALKLAAEG